MISRIINKQNIIVAFCNSTQLNSNLTSFKIFASFFDVLNKLCHCEPNEVKVWQSTFNELLNSVKSKYAIFEHSKFVNSLLFKIIN